MTQIHDIQWVKLSPSGIVVRLGLGEIVSEEWRRVFRVIAEASAKQTPRMVSARSLGDVGPGVLDVVIAVHSTHEQVRAVLEQVKADLKATDESYAAALDSRRGIEHAARAWVRGNRGGLREFVIGEPGHASL